VLWNERIADQVGRKIVGKSEFSCHIYRGCPYKEICLTSVGTKLDEEIVETLYEKVDDPLAYLKEER